MAFTADLACFHFHASGRRLPAIRRLCRILWEDCSFHLDSRQGIHSFFFLVLVHLQCIAFFFSSAALGCDRALRIRNHSLGNARRSGLARHLASVAWTAAQRLRDFFCLVFDAWCCGLMLLHGFFLTLCDFVLPSVLDRQWKALFCSSIILRNLQQDPRLFFSLFRGKGTAGRDVRSVMVSLFLLACLLAALDVSCFACLLVFCLLDLLTFACRMFLCVSCISGKVQAMRVAASMRCTSVAAYLKLAKSGSFSGRAPYLRRCS